MSPRAELRRWPMWAALFGLIAVCSTMALRFGWWPLPRRLVSRSSRNAPAFEEEVQIAVRRGRTAHALERSEGAGDLLSDRPRRLAQTPRELERNRRAESPSSRLGGYSRATVGLRVSSSA